MKGKIEVREMKNYQDSSKIKACFKKQSTCAAVAKSKIEVRGMKNY